ncbi:hypothetical protein [Aeromicrobium sp. UC242_57]|uniref:hypothetical protein n=1 Tax=Aeromicrobium sp. UC242_57 TaxID=3374624 RepID=UPI0037A1A8B5
MPETPEKNRTRRRLFSGSGLFKVSVSQLAVAALIGGLAFAIMVQVRDDGSDDYSGVRGENLVELLKSLDSANERLTTQIDDLRTTRDDLLSSTKRSKQAQEQAKTRAEARDPGRQRRRDRSGHRGHDL